ncbi:MAG: efflux RND transporter periplasmic adaptor subunit [Planctomycetota bacterium]
MVLSEDQAQDILRRPPRLKKAAIVVPFVVGVVTLVLIAWSAWPVLRPAREVRAEQAVFDRSLDVTIDVSNNASTRSTTVVQAAGWLEAEPFFTACTALTDGVVESIEVLEGDYVEKGQVVARLVAEDSEIRLRESEATVANARAELSLAQAELAAAESAWNDPVDLERAVESGRAAYAEREAELAQLPAIIDGVQATLVRLEEELKRTEKSAEGGATTEFEVIVAKQRVATQRAEVEATKARQPLLEARVARLHADLRAAERDLALRIEDRRRLDSARASVALAESQVARAIAERDKAELELDRMTIRAPIAGYVQRRLKLPGDKAIRMMDSPHSAHIVHLYDPSRLQVRVDVPLADAAHVFVGQECEVVVEVLPDQTFKGRVLRTTHEADLQKNTLEVKVQVIDPKPILRPEMLTRIKFLPAGSASSATNPKSHSLARILIPEESIVQNDNGSFVWTIVNRRNGRGVLHARAVSLISPSDEWVTISSDLQPGALIALDTGDAYEGEVVIVLPTHHGEES